MIVERPSKDVNIFDTPVEPLDLFDPLIRVQYAAGGQAVLHGEDISACILGIGAIRAICTSMLVESPFATEELVNKVDPNAKLIRNLLYRMTDLIQISEHPFGSPYSPDWVNSARRNLGVARLLREKSNGEIISEPLDSLGDMVMDAHWSMEMSVPYGLAYSLRGALRRSIYDDVRTILGERYCPVYDYVGSDTPVTSGQAFSEMVDRFRVEAHDLKNPLTAIMGNSQLATRFYDRGNLERAASLTASVASSIEALCVRAQYSRGRLVENTHRIEVLTVDEVSDSLSTGLRAFLSSVGLEVNDFPVEVDPEIPEHKVHWSVQEINRLAENCGDNWHNKGKSYAGKGLQGVGVKLGQTTDKKFLVITIYDNMGGVDQRIRDNNGRFSHKLTGWRGNVKGTGIGMASMAKDITTIYKGSVTIHQIELEDGNLGAEVKILVPFAA